MRTILKPPSHRVVLPLKMKVKHGPDVPKEQINSLRAEIEEAVLTELRIHPAVKPVPPNTLKKDPIKKAKLIKIRY